MYITGSIVCYDTSDLCDVRTTGSQTADIACLDSTDSFESYGIIVNKTIALSDGGTYVQGQQLFDNNLFLDLYSPTLIGWTNVDGTFIDAVYTEPRPFNPIWINYGIFSQDGSGWALDGYRYRTPMNPQVGHFYANMITPDDLGVHKIQWLYKKDNSSYATAVDQTFSVKVWGNEVPGPFFDPQFPMVVTLPQLAVWNLGETHTFTLDIRGNIPLPLTFMWRKSGVNLTDGGHFAGSDTSALTVSNITLAEGGYYTCVVASAVESTVSWLVVDPP